tara:strand:- start:882 stop:1499 length:618 start_codon:yes stop_codon:yes gene_type:complete
MDNSKINMHKRMAMGQKPTGMKKGGMKQGYRAREDESLGMRRGKESSKKQSMAARRNESYGKFGRRPNQKINKMMGGGMGGRSGDMMYSRGYGVGERSKRMPTMLQDRGAMKKGGVAAAAKKVRASGMKKGGLKSVDKSKNPGLAKLPTSVRNKMGYMKKGGRTNTRRMNRLEELGRVDAEKAYSKKGKRNLRSEKRRIVRELKK